MSDSLSFKAEFLEMRADCKQFVPLVQVNLFVSISYLYFF